MWSKGQKRNMCGDDPVEPWKWYPDWRNVPISEIYGSTPPPPPSPRVFGLVVGGGMGEGSIQVHPQSDVCGWQEYKYLFAFVRSCLLLFFAGTILWQTERCLATNWEGIVFKRPPDFRWARTGWQRCFRMNRVFLLPKYRNLQALCHTQPIRRRGR